MCFFILRNDALTDLRNHLAPKPEGPIQNSSVGGREVPSLPKLSEAPGCSVGAQRGPFREWGNPMAQMDQIPHQLIW